MDFPIEANPNQYDIRVQDRLSMISVPLAIRVAL
jgi:hypothetical protein